MNTTIHTAVCGHQKVTVYMTDEGYRRGSQFYTLNDTPCTPDPIILEATFLWSEGPMRDSISLHDFLNKALNEDL